MAWSLHDQGSGFSKALSATKNLFCSNSYYLMLSLEQTRKQFMPRRQLDNWTFLFHQVPICRPVHTGRVHCVWTIITVRWDVYLNFYSWLSVRKHILEAQGPKTDICTSDNKNLRHSLEAQGLTAYCFKYIDRPLWLWIDDLQCVIRYYHTDMANIEDMSFISCLICLTVFQSARQYRQH